MSEGFTGKAIELFNHGLEQSGMALSRIAEKEVGVQVTSISRQVRDGVYKNAHESNHISVTQTFVGKCSGMLLLQGEAYHYVQLMTDCMNDECSLDALPEMDNETICELGNIILNAILRTLSILSQSRFYCSLPSRVSADGIKHIFSESGAYKSDVTIFDMEYSWRENNRSAAIPLCVQLHFEDDSKLKDWEARAYGSSDMNEK